MKGLERLAEVAQTRPALRQRAGFAPLSITVRSGDAATSVRIAQAVTVAPGASADAAFSLIASADTWAKFAETVPPVGYQSLVGMVRMGYLRIEGDVLAFGRNMLFLEQLLAGLRPEVRAEAPARVGTPSIEPVTGRYLRLDFNGWLHRIYFEEAGQGVPLICLHTAGSVACLIAPTSPSADAWETLWHYMQGGPGVFLGDLHYYFTDGDLRNGLLDTLDTKRCPLHLLTGEYDLSATPELTAELARLVKATSFQVMKGMGHFPMSENPAQFRKYLLPVLDRI